MRRQDLAVRPIEPREQQELVADIDPLERLGDVRLEVDPGIRRALVALLGSGRRVGQRRLDPADRAEVERQRYGRVSQSTSGWA
jgi:hypothetical protein